MKIGYVMDHVIRATRLGSAAPEVEVHIIDPGEYVCRDVECVKCTGTGIHDENEYRGPNYLSMFVDCPRCNGTGVVPERVG